MAKRNLKIRDKVCWSFGGRYSKYYPKKNELCGKLRDLNPSIAPNSYEVKLDRKSIKLLEELDKTQRNPIIYPFKDVVRKSMK